MNQFLYQILILLWCFTTIVQGLKCYTCSTSQDSVDQRCVTDPSTVQGRPVTNCNKQYCISTRVEYIDPKNKIQSISRDCVDKPIFINKVVEDSTYRIYYKACQSDLCNGGTGKELTNSGGLIGDDGEAIVLLVKGIGEKRNSASSPSITSMFLFVFIIITLYT